MKPRAVALLLCAIACGAHTATAQAASPGAAQVKKVVGTASYTDAKGGGPLNQDILAGVTDVAIGSLTSFSPHVRANKVRALAVTGEKRTPALPDTSTLIEQGVKAFPSYSWWGVYAPTGTPRPIVDRMHAEIKKAVLAPDVTQKFVDQFNMEILTTSPEEFAAYQKSEQERWFKVIKDNDIKGD